MELLKLSEFFPWSTDLNSNLEGCFVLCIDNGAFSGEFVLTELLVKLLREKRTVGLISANHSASHYDAILRRNALDLRQLESSGQLNFISISIPEMLNSNNLQSWEGLLAWKDSKFSEGNLGQQHPGNEEEEEGSPSRAENSSSSGGVSIVIDDLDAFELLAKDAQSARRFISSTQSILAKSSATLVAHGRVLPENLTSASQSTNSSSSSSTVAVLPGSQLPRDQEDPSLTEYCRYRADVTVAVSPLSTGFSSQVHGLVTVTNSFTTAAVPVGSLGRTGGNTGSVSLQLLRPGGQTQIQQVLQYKAMDSGIKCAPAGRISGRG